MLLIRVNWRNQTIKNVFFKIVIGSKTRKIQNNPETNLKGVTSRFFLEKLRLNARGKNQVSKSTAGWHIERARHSWESPLQIRLKASENWIEISKHFPANWRDLNWPEKRFIEKYRHSNLLLGKLGIFRQIREIVRRKAILRTTFSIQKAALDPFHVEKQQKI